MPVHHLKVTNSPPSLIELNPPDTRDIRSSHKWICCGKKQNSEYRQVHHHHNKQPLLTIRSVQFRDHVHHHKQKANIKNMNCKLTKRSVSRLAFPCSPSSSASPSNSLPSSQEDPGMVDLFSTQN